MHRGNLFTFAIVSAVVFVGLASSSVAMPNPSAPIIVQPGAVSWQPLKGLSGVSHAVIYGDPTKAGGQYAVRYKCDNGAKIPPHWHPQAEQVTVLSGTFMAGIGDKMDPAKMVSLPAGAFVELPAGLHHYAMCKGATVVEVHGIGPDVINMVK